VGTQPLDDAPLQALDLIDLNAKRLAIVPDTMLTICEKPTCTTCCEPRALLHPVERVLELL
jgi:hypothetical protein